MTEVKIDAITKSYIPGKIILPPIDLLIHPGELFFLLGPSGCGKSTLLRILAGLVPPSGGSIFFNGVNIDSLPPEKRHAAMVFQNYALWPHLSVFENVAFGLRAAGKKREEIRKTVSAALEIVHLADCAERKIPSLSGGQQQRVALARALAVDPALLLLDEPLSNLDARLRDTMRGEIRRICKEKSLTALYVTHDRSEALSMADRIALMNGGKIEQLGTPGELYNRPVSSFAAKFLGDANLFEKDWLKRFPKLAQWEKPLGMVRPERIRFAGDFPEAASEIRFPARLEERTFLGDRSEWSFSGGGVLFIVSESAPPLRETGRDYLLTFDLADLIGLDA